MVEITKRRILDQVRLVLNWIHYLVRQPIIIPSIKQFLCQTINSQSPNLKLLKEQLFLKMSTSKFLFIIQYTLYTCINQWYREIFERLETVKCLYATTKLAITSRLCVLYWFAIDCYVSLINTLLHKAYQSVN